VIQRGLPGRALSGLITLTVRPKACKSSVVTRMGGSRWRKRYSPSPLCQWCCECDGESIMDAQRRFLLKHLGQTVIRPR
jgi:hypothetical protein